MKRCIIFLLPGMIWASDMSVAISESDVVAVRYHLRGVRTVSSLTAWLQQAEQVVQQHQCNLTWSDRDAYLFGAGLLELIYLGTFARHLAVHSATDRQEGAKRTTSQPLAFLKGIGFVYHLYHAVKFRKDKGMCAFNLGNSLIKLSSSSKALSHTYTPQGLRSILMMHCPLLAAFYGYCMYHGWRGTSGRVLYDRAVAVRDMIQRELNPLHG